MLDLERIKERAAERLNATEIKVRAERLCVELLERTIEHGGDRRSESRSNTPTLNDMGLTMDESSRSKELASMPTATASTPANPASWLTPSASISQLATLGKVCITPGQACLQRRDRAVSI